MESLADGEWQMVRAEKSVESAIYRWTNAPIPRHAVRIIGSFRSLQQKANS